MTGRNVRAACPVDCHDFLFRYCVPVLLREQHSHLPSSAFSLWWGGCQVFQRATQNLPVQVVYLIHEVSTMVLLTLFLSPGTVLQTKAICVNVRWKQVKWATNTIKTNLLFIFEWLFGHALIAIIISSSSRESACTLTALHFHLTWVIVTFTEVVLIVTIHLLVHEVESGRRPN